MSLPLNGLILLCCGLALSSCNVYSNYIAEFNAPKLAGTCISLNQPTFLFEGRCADITGINNNSELCMSVQAAGVGGFPEDWAGYLRIRDEFDKEKFDKLLLEKQRTMVAILEEGTEVRVTRAVNHLWGTVGSFWVVRGSVLVDDSELEVEFPSHPEVHLRPFWFDSRSEGPPTLESEFFDSC